MSPWCLSQSGMPVPETSFLDGLSLDIAHPCVEAMPAFETRLAELFNVPVERVRVTVGASSAMQMASMLWFRSGARVLAEAPAYEPLNRLPAFFGAQVMPLRRRLENGWLIEPEDVAQACSQSGAPTHAFITNSHNPTGVTMDGERMAAIGAELEKTGGVLVSCEAYMEYLPNARRVHAFDATPNGVSIGTLTKAYGLGALRIGWLILGEGVAQDHMALTDMSYLAYLDPPTPSLVAGRRALDHLAQLSQPIRRIEVESRPHWVRWLQETPGIRAVVPEFGINAFPRIEGVDDTAALTVYLQREHGVDVVPGEYFGAGGHLRVSCGVPEETLKEGLERLTNGIDSWRRKKP